MRTAGASPTQVGTDSLGCGGFEGQGSCLCSPPWPPGLLHHRGDKTSFSSRFGQGSIIGVHLDTWHGTLTFFKNRKCIGKKGCPGCHGVGGRVSTVDSGVFCPPRSGCHQAAESEVLPHGLFHGGQEQHEGDPRLRQHHLTAVPVLLPPASAAAHIPGHAGGPALAPWPQAAAAPQAGLGAQHELRPPLTRCHAAYHSWLRQPRA